jgi:hypothetical protein
MIIEPTETGVNLTQVSILSGVRHTLPIPLARVTFERALIAWRAGALIQDSFPTLTEDQREFIKTGITPQEWGAIFNNVETT